MIPTLNDAAVADVDDPTEPRVLSVSVCGRRVLCGVLRTAPTAARQVRDRIKIRLASTLWKRHCALTGDWNASRIGHSFKLRRDRLGKPSLTVDECEELPISFTHIPGTSWAALCHGGQVGIDAAEFREFEGAYPFHRAFHDDECLFLTTAPPGTVQEAAALIWSAKEAAVKAEGSGFHRIDPREAKIKNISLDGQRASSEVHFERKHREEITDGPSAIPVRSFLYRDGWISVALTLSPPSYTGRGDVRGIMYGYGRRGS